MCNSAEWSGVALYLELSHAMGEYNVYSSKSGSLIYLEMQRSRAPRHILLPVWKLYFTVDARSSV